MLISIRPRKYTLLPKRESRRLSPMHRCSAPHFSLMPGQAAALLFPDAGKFICKTRQKDRMHGLIEADMEVKDGAFIVKAGCRCLPVKDGAWSPEARKNAPIVDGVLARDYETNAPSTAAWVGSRSAQSAMKAASGSGVKKAPRSLRRSRESTYCTACPPLRWLPARMDMVRSSADGQRRRAAMAPGGRFRRR